MRTKLSWMLRNINEKKTGSIRKQWKCYCSQRAAPTVIRQFYCVTLLPLKFLTASRIIIIIIIIIIFDSNRNDTRCEMPRQLISGEKWEWQRYGQRLLDMNVHTPLIPEKVLTSKENDNYTDLVLHHPLLPPPPPQVYQREKYFSCNVLQK